MVKDKEKKPKRNDAKRSKRMHDDEEEDFDEVASEMSVLSTTGSDDLEVFSGGEQGEGRQSDAVQLEDSLKEIVSTLTEYGKKKQKDALINNLSKLLQSRASAWVYLGDNLETLTECLIDSVKRGRPQEKHSAATALGLLTCHTINITMNDPESYYLRCLKEPLVTLLTDATEVVACREKAASTLAIACTSFCETPEEFEYLANVFEGVYMGSGLKGDKTPKTVTPAVADFHEAVLGSWCYLITSGNVRLTDKQISNIIQLLQSPDVDVRLAAGEAISLIYETEWNRITKYKCTAHGQLLEKVLELSKESSKGRSKRDLKLQKSGFRDLHAFLTQATYPADVDVKISSSEVIHLTNWAERVLYNFICSILVGGTKTHLSENPGMRVDFGLPAEAANSLNTKGALLTHDQKSRMRAEVAAERKQSRGKARNRKLPSFSQDFDD